MHRQLPRRVGLGGREGDHPPAAGGPGRVLQLRGLAAQRFQALAHAPLLVFGLDQVLLERLAEALVAGDLRRGAKLRQRLQLDRVHVGQVLDELLVAVAIPLAGADAGLQVVEPGAGAVGLERRGLGAVTLAHALEQLFQRLDPAVARLPAKLLARPLGGHQRHVQRHVEPARRRRLQAQPPAQVGEAAHHPGRHREAAHADPLGHLLGAERRLGGDVESAVHIGQDGSQVGPPDVLGVHGLEAQAVDPGQRRQEAAAQEEVGQERPDEEAADLGRGLVLEDQARDAAARPASRDCRLRSGPARAPPRPCGASRRRSGCPRWASSRRPRDPWGRASRRRPRRRGPASARRPRPTASKTRRLPSTLIRSSVTASREGWIAQARWMTASAPSKIAPRSAVRTLASTQLVFGGAQVGSRRASPTISSISWLSLRAWTVLVPTFPVAPVTTTFIFFLAFRRSGGSELARSERRTAPLGLLASVPPGAGAKRGCPGRESGFAHLLAFPRGGIERGS